MIGKSVALAGGAFMAMLAGPVAADPCSDFRLALAVEDAASTVVVETLRERTGRTYEKRLTDHEAASRAKREASDRVEGAMIAVRRTVADEAAAMIDAMHTAREAAERAFSTARDWFIQWHYSSTGVDWDLHQSMADATRAADRAYRDSVKAVCDVRGRK